MIATTARALLTAAAVSALVPAAAVAQGRVAIGLQQEPTSLDPTSDATAAISVMLTQNLHEGLTTVDQSGAVQPQLGDR